MTLGTSRRAASVEAVVFDSDGTLVRTPDLIIAYRHVAEQHGLVPRTREQLEQAGAGYVIDMFAELPDMLATIEAR